MDDRVHGNRFCGATEEKLQMIKEKRLRKTKGKAKVSKVRPCLKLIW